MTYNFKTVSFVVEEAVYTHHHLNIETADKMKYVAIEFQNEILEIFLSNLLFYFRNQSIEFLEKLRYIHVL